MANNTQWEYHVEVLGTAFRSVKPEGLAAALNEFGEMGWEVVNLHHPESSNKLWVTMRRPLSHAARRRRSRPDEAW
jgi:hypothetical protein